MQHEHFHAAKGKRKHLNALLWDYMQVCLRFRSAPMNVAIWHLRCICLPPLIAQHHLHLLFLASHAANRSATLQAASCKARWVAAQCKLSSWQWMHHPPFTVLLKLLTIFNCICHQHRQLGS